MSTTDPNLARKARENARPGTARVLTLLVLLLIGGTAAGYGWTTMSVFDGYADPPVLAIVAIPVGMMLSIICTILWFGVVMKRSDVGIAYGFAMILVGGAIGTFVAALSADMGGLALTLGWVILGLGLLLLVLGGLAATGRRVQRSRDDELMRTGTLVTATVSDKGYLAFHESPRILTVATFTFTDLQGTQRWVQKPVMIHQSDPLLDGQETRLWFDATNPGDERSIVVEAAKQRERKA